MAHHRTVTSDHVTYFIESIAATRSAEVRYAESSMRNGFGLKLLHKFFNLPFLQLQRETLLKQLERNEQETQLTVQELDMYFSSDEANYSKFLDNLVKKRREIADSNANIPIVPIVTSTSQQFGDKGVQMEVKRSQSGPIFIGAGKPIPIPAARTSVTTKTTTNLTNSTAKLSIKDDKKTDGKITSVEEFCPDEGQLDRSFLEDISNSSQQITTQEPMDSDSDADIGNPLVSEFQDDLDPEDYQYNSKPASQPGAPDGQSPQNHVNEEIDGDRSILVNDEYDSTLNSEISEITSEAFDNWLSSNSKWRRSPEGNNITDWC